MERYLITYCAPTLAALKPASLFCYPLGERKDLDEQLARWVPRLDQRGLALVVLRRDEDRALLYLCHRRLLQAELNRPDSAAFLRRYGYDTTGLVPALERLRQRIQEAEGFPHEIGVFLGYPLEDVVGFIENRGQNCKVTGYWKVYGDEDRARALFARFRKCHEVYARLWRLGRPVERMIVAA